MQTLSAFETGEIICPVPDGSPVLCGELVLSDCRRIPHSDDFNATVISRFLIATRPLAAGEAVAVNLNTFLYDAVDDSHPGVVGFRALSAAEQQRLYKYADESVRQRAIADGFVPQAFGSPGVSVVRGRSASLAAVSCASFAAQCDVFSTAGLLLPFPLRSTIELPGDQHLRLTGGPEFLRHACQPNLRLEIAGDVIRGVALRPIEPGEELTYNYLCTEWDIAQPFRCVCSTYACYGLIRGFRYLDAEQQGHLLPSASVSVREKCGAVPAVLHEAAAVVIARDGAVTSRHDVPAGSVILRVNRVRVRLRGAVVDHLRLAHRCDANTALLEDRLVASRALQAGEPLTLNLSMLYGELPQPFECTCGAERCARTVRGFFALEEAERNRLMPLVAYPVVSEAVRRGHRVYSSNPRIEVREAPPMGRATFATANIDKGTRIFHLQGLMLPFPTVFTVFIGKGKHLLFSDGAQCLAHSCKPNTRLVLDAESGTASCFALRDIQPGEMVSFNYLTSEWDMTEPFRCSCKTSSCHGIIKGFRYLDERSQLRIWPYVTPAVKMLFAQHRHSTLASLDNSLVFVHPDTGEIRVARDLPSGAILFENKASNFSVVGDEVVLDGMRVKHTCNPSAVILESKIVLCRASQRGDAVTLNVNHLTYHTPAFACHCGYDNCVGKVSGFSGLTDDEKDRVMLYVDPLVRVKAVENGYLIRSSSPLVEVRANGGLGQSTFAACDIRKGTRFFGVTGLVIPFPTVYTILLDDKRHLLFAGGAQCLAHSCDPTVRVIVDDPASRLDCIALRDIKKGELISFNYLCTEWDMQSPFKCLCETPKCYSDIRGFKYLSDEARLKLWSMTTPAIRKLAITSKDADAWNQLASTRLLVGDSGLVKVATEMTAGTVLIHVSTVEIGKGFLSIEGLRLRHHCSPTTALIDGRIVLIRPVASGHELTIDLNCVGYLLSEEFVCNCSHVENPHTVEGFKSLSTSEKTKRFSYADPSVQAAAIRDGYIVECISSLIGVRCGAVGLVAFAVAHIAAGTRFFQTSGLCLPFATRSTVQIDVGRHLLLSGGVQYLCHSCEPNSRICVDAVNRTIECLALRDIDKDELITINYAATEWELRAPFQCLCSAPGCTQQVRGFKYLSSAERTALAGHATPAMRHLAGMHMALQLPPYLRERTAGALEVARNVRRGTVLLDSCENLDIRRTHIFLGNYGCVVPHVTVDPSSVLVEGRLVAMRDIREGEPLTVDMNLFVYDMQALFPSVADEGEDKGQDEKEARGCCGFRYLDDSTKQRMLYLCEPPVRAHAMRDGWIVKSSSPLIEVRPNGEMGQTAYAVAPIEEGCVLFRATGLVLPYPTMYTICVGESHHLLFGDAAECIAHHCDPNVRVVVQEEKETFEFVTLRPIARGEMITFNYCTTEWIMRTPFACLCDSPHCAGNISGFRYLSEADRQRLWPITSSVIKRCAAYGFF